MDLYKNAGSDRRGHVLRKQQQIVESSKPDPTNVAVVMG